MKASVYIACLDVKSSSFFEDEIHVGFQQRVVHHFTHLNEHRCSITQTATTTRSDHRSQTSAGNKCCHLPNTTYLTVPWARAVSAPPKNFTQTFVKKRTGPDLETLDLNPNLDRQSPLHAQCQFTQCLII